MPLDIQIDPAQPAWPDVQGAEHGMIERIVYLNDATVEGNAAVALLIRLPDGRFVIGQTTYRLFNTAARSIAASPHVRAD